MDSGGGVHEVIGVIWSAQAARSDVVGIINCNECCLAAKDEECNINCSEGLFRDFYRKLIMLFDNEKWTFKINIQFNWVTIINQKCGKALSIIVDYKRRIWFGQKLHLQILDCVAFYIFKYIESCSCDLSWTYLWF